MDERAQESEVCEFTYLSIISFAHAEQGVQRVVSWDQKAGKIDKKLASNIEEDQEEID